MEAFDLILINPPTFLEHIPFDQSSTRFLTEPIRTMVMNPAILSLASYLESRGYAIHIIDLSLSTDYQAMAAEIEKFDAKYVGISSTSGFDYIESLRIAKIVKEKLGCPVIIGGQHAGPLGRIVLHDSSDVDAVVLYEGEWVLGRLISSGWDHFCELPGVISRYDKELTENRNRPPMISLDDMPFLNYKLYPNYLMFTPFVEESRGCLYGCEYCTSNTVNQNTIRIKSPSRFLKEMENCIDVFGRDKAYAVLSLTFGVNPQYALEIARGMKNLGVKWSSEFRADSKWEIFIDDLLEAGYEVFNIGLESASAEILIRMGKTNNPIHYLRRMSNLALIVNNSQSSVRANLLFYIGETPATLRETLSYLSATPGINSIACSPLMLFHGTPLFKHFDRYRQKFGSELMCTEYWKSRHIYPVHPSRFFSFQEVALFGKIVQKVFSEEEKWIDAAKYRYSQLNSSTQETAKAALRDSIFRRLL